jgi:hypothetical protein
MCLTFCVSQGCSSSSGFPHEVKRFGELVFNQANGQLVRAILL